MPSTQFTPLVCTDLSATIAVNASRSGGVNLNGTELVGIIMPAAWTAAALTFRVSIDGVNWHDLHKTDDTVYSATVSGGNAYPLSPTDFAGWQYIQFQSGTTAAPVNQAAQAVIQILSRPV